MTNIKAYALSSYSRSDVKVAQDFITIQHALDSVMNVIQESEKCEE